MLIYEVEVEVAVEDCVRLANEEQWLYALNIKGYAVLANVLSQAMCEELMAHVGTEVSEAAIVGVLRGNPCQGLVTWLMKPSELLLNLMNDLYTLLCPLANDWYQRLGKNYRFPSSFRELFNDCADWGQHRSLIYISVYGEGDHEILHNCIRGEHRVFPMQAVVQLSQPGNDYQGGELILVQRSDCSSPQTTELVLAQGDIALIPVGTRPDGYCKTKVRHGVRPIISGERRTLNIVFHLGRGREETGMTELFYRQCSPGKPSSPNSLELIRYEVKPPLSLK